jgi:hypothetical protein
VSDGTRHKRPRKQFTTAAHCQLTLQGTISLRHSVGAVPLHRRPDGGCLELCHIHLVINQGCAASLQHSSYLDYHQPIILGSTYTVQTSVQGRILHVLATPTFAPAFLISRLYKSLAPIYLNIAPTTRPECIPQHLPLLVRS